MRREAALPADAAALRRALARTWHAFLAPFCGKPTAVQLAAAGPVLAGGDVLVEAPTASGKTEAVAAPLVERLLDEGARPPAIVYVVPTRALVNDLYRRLAVPLGSLGVSLDRRTGDHPRPVGRRPPAVLLTTPESLDAMLCRYPKTLAQARAVVCDEVHLLEGSGRGDQVAVLLARLRAIAAAGGRRLQVVALSATAGCAERVAGRFLVDGARVAVGGQRPISMNVETWPGGRFVGARVRAAVEAGARKVLVFVNRRQDAEELAGLLGRALPFGDATFAHHGSLARSVRESVEKRFLDAKHACVVATSTLELGIDVGDVDLVVLPFPPADVTSFLQRVGRGNRRTGTSRVLAFARSPADEAWLAFLARSAAAGRLWPDAVPLRASVLMQQLVSLLFQSPGRWVTAGALHARLPAAYAREFEVARIERLAGALVEDGLLARGPRGRLVATGRLEHEFERGRVHSAIDPEPAGMTVFDELTREPLGTVAAAGPGAQPDTISLAGRGMRVVHASADGIYVRGGTVGDAAKYPARPGPRKSLALAQGFRAHLGLAQGGPVLVRAGGQHVLVHFGGTLASRLLAAWLERMGHAGSAAYGGLAVRFAPKDARRVDLPMRVELEELVEDLAGDLVRLVGGGPFAKLLPRAEQVAFARAAAQIDDISRIFEGGIGAADLPDGIGLL